MYILYHHILCRYNRWKTVYLLQESSNRSPRQICKIDLTCNPQSAGMRGRLYFTTKQSLGSGRFGAGAGVGELQMQTAISPAPRSPPRSQVVAGCLCGRPPHGSSLPFLCLHSTTSDRIQEVQQIDQKNSLLTNETIIIQNVSLTFCPLLDPLPLQI